MIVATLHAVPLALLFLAGFCVGYNAACRILGCNTHPRNNLI